MDAVNPMAQQLRLEATEDPGRLLGAGRRRASLVSQVGQRIRARLSVLSLVRRRADQPRLQLSRPARGRRLGRARGTRLRQ